MNRFRRILIRWEKKVESYVTFCMRDYSLTKSYWDRLLVRMMRSDQSPNIKNHSPD